MSVESCWSRGGRYGITKKKLIRNMAKLRRELDAKNQEIADLHVQLSRAADALDVLGALERKESNRKVYRFRVPRKNGTVKYVEYPVWMLEK